MERKGEERGSKEVSLSGFAIFLFSLPSTLVSLSCPLPSSFPGFYLILYNEWSLNQKNEVSHLHGRLERKSSFKGRSGYQFGNLIERVIINKRCLRKLHPLSRFIYTTSGMRGEDSPLVKTEPREECWCLNQVCAFLYSSRKDVWKTVETFEDAANILLWESITVFWLG